MKALRTINYVSRQTGLGIHAIRVWEKRYGAVKPARAANNRRLYSEKEVERLKLLRQATGAGHSIGQIARLSSADLHRLLNESWATPARKGAKEAQRPLLAAALSAISAMNAPKFQDVLDRAAIDLGSPGVLFDFIAPLTIEIGDAWRAGELSIVQEHFATNLIAVFLNIFARPFTTSESTPRLLLATPSGQHHELGAMLAAAAARSHGWATTYLGAALPVEELLRAARALNPRAVGLSIVFPVDDALLRSDLRKLDRYLPPACAILLGGCSAANYRAVFKRRVHMVPKLKDLFGVLDKIARPVTRSRKRSSRS
ncbi:MAG: MerR family transcriptional regulator [Verrucomicrobiota bacterium]|nr:MerR family transcriptional regulator [Verrucomicrobiota bacterium]